jgi:hypothetical protein
MFRIVLRPDEQAILRSIEDGLDQHRVPESAMLGLMALRMLVRDERGRPRLTLLGQAALARMGGKIH